MCVILTLFAEFSFARKYHMLTKVEWNCKIEWYWLILEAFVASNIRPNYLSTTVCTNVWWVWRVRHFWLRPGNGHFDLTLLCFSIFIDGFVCFFASSFMILSGSLFFSSELSPLLFPVFVQLTQFYMLWLIEGATIDRAIVLVNCSSFSIYYKWFMRLDYAPIHYNYVIIFTF